MKPIAILSGDKRQKYILKYLKTHGYNAYLKSTMDFNNDDILVCSTPFCKNKKFINCDFYSSFPLRTFLSLLKPNQIVFGGNIPTVCKKIANIKFVDTLQLDNIVWKNAILTAEGLIMHIIKNTDFAIENSEILVLGYGNCGTNIGKKLNALGGKVTFYDHTEIHLIGARANGFKTVQLEDFDTHLNKFDIIINTVPQPILSDKHYSLLSKNTVLFDVSSQPFGFNKDLTCKNHLSLITCPGIPGATAPKNAGELIAKSIISYLERTEINES